MSTFKLPYFWGILQYQPPNDLPPNAYLKDLDGDYDRFIGNWLWTNNNDTLMLSFQKIEMSIRPTMRYYSDYLIGEYRYVENGVEIVNTLPVNYDESPLNNNYMSIGITTRNHPDICPECNLNPRYILGYIDDPNQPDLDSKMFMVYFVENGVEKIKIKVYKSIGITLTEDPNPTGQIAIPRGIYTLVKQ